MVFFTCSHCGSALKKNKVEKHYALECHKPPAVSCMDCLKDFIGQEYVSHIKCVTEEQKYSGQPLNKLQIAKGERKQMEWVETVRQIIDTKGSTLTSQERQLLEKMKDFENIPRKKKKFENFLKNAMGRYVDPWAIERVWSLLEGHKAEAAKNKETTPSPTKEAEDDQPEHTGGGKKKKDKTSKEIPEKVKESQEDEEVTVGVTNGDVTLKKKKHTSCAVEGDHASEVVEEESSESEKKKRKQKKNKEHLESNTAVNEASEEMTTPNSRETGKLEADDQSSPKETTPKLSKKEKKEKKKKQKYELELENIAKETKVEENHDSLGEKDMELDQVETQDEVKGNKSKKSKKKKKDKDGQEANTDENAETAVINDMKGKEKKKGKRKHDVNAEESGDKKRIKEGVGESDDVVNGSGGVTESGLNGVTANDVKSKGKFKWDKTIVAILKAVPDNELLVKRLRKKVLSEYQESLGESKCQELSFEEAMAMFERKLLKIPGVKVLKDKAKLVKSS